MSYLFDDEARYGKRTRAKTPSQRTVERRLERARKRRARQFGGLKREWIMSMRCAVTGEYGTDFLPIDPAHVGSPDPDERGQSTRGAGADATYMAPLRRDVHNDFDNLPAGKFENVRQTSKQWIRELAAQLDHEWQGILRRALAEIDEAEIEGESSDDIDARIRAILVAGSVTGG